MWLEKIRGYIAPGAAEKDEGFRRLIEKLSRQGLRVIVGVELIVPAFMFVLQYLIMPNLATWELRIWQTLGVMAVGVLTALAARLARPGWPLRLIGCVSGWLAGAVLVTCSLYLSGRGGVGDHFIPGQLTTVLLVGVGAVPMRPLHTLSLGLATWSYYLIAGSFGVLTGRIPAVDPEGANSVFIIMTTLLSAALSALLYAERHSNYLSHQQALRASESLCKAQSRALLSENAASLARLAAALSHELNNPLGALTSAVDSMVLLAARQATSPPSEHERLVRLQADLRRSISDSVKRLREIVFRMQRFTNLDKADVQRADVNALLTDVVALIEPEIKDSIKVELDLQPVRPLVCRPQQLSAVFSSLLHNAVSAVQNGDGHIRISTRQTDSQVEIRIQDSGRGLRAAELAMIFDPGFKISEGRVLTGNWSLFSSRQIIREHGGDIRIESMEGQGTTVSVLVPGWEESELS